MNILVFLYFILILPKLLYTRLVHGKKHPGFSQRLGLSIPSSNDYPTIWIHAVSVGEVKAAQPLFQQLKERYPNHFFLITTTTATGQAEAHRSIPQANAIAYLPLDLTPIVNRWIQKLNPVLFVLIETDFWPNLLKALKQSNCKIVLASGKLSEKSSRRYHLFAPFSRSLFSHFDLLCLQNEEHKTRFKNLSDPTLIHVTGNLKYDLQPEPIPTFQFPTPAITIASTHAPEETLLLNAIQHLDLFIFLAPRHPERFNEVAELLANKKIPYIRWTEREKRGGEKVILVDAMGQLPICYSHSLLAIVGGSFIPHIGGHNILEPMLYGTPVLFGPHMFKQREFVSRTLLAGAGELVDLVQLPIILQKVLENPQLQATMREAATALIQSNRGATSRTMQLIRKNI